MKTNQKTNLTVPVMTDPPGVIQPAPQIDYRSPGMGFCGANQSRNSLHDGFSNRNAHSRSREFAFKR